MKFICPDCEQHLTAGPELAGKIVKCPACDARVQIPDFVEPEPGDVDRSESEDALSQEPRIKFTDHKWSDQSNVPFWQAGSIGLAFTILLYILLIPIWSTTFGKYFTGNGWISYTLVFMLGCCIGILSIKYKRQRRQEKAMLLDVLPASISEDISDESLPAFIEHLNKLPEKLNNSFMVNRIRRGLEHFYVRKSNPEVAAMMQSQSDIDATGIQGSYTMIRVFIWAIPILGFIGTVMGISIAVAGLAGDAGADTAQMMEKIGTVTSGLGTAFQTTLVALVFSIVVSFPANWLQQREEDLLNQIDEYCNENLLKRLNDKGGITDVVINTESIAREMQRNMSVDQTEVLASFRDIQDQLANTQSDHMKLFAEASGKLADHLDKTALASDAHQKRVEETLETLVKSVESEGRAAMHQAAASLESQFTTLEETIQTLNQVLGQLGEHQVVIQQIEPAKKRGWFGR